MTREEKGIIINELADKLSKTPYFYIADSSGLSVKEINSFRRICFDKGVEYKVYKNTLIAKALERLDSDYSPLREKVLKGTSGIIFSPNSGQLPAKLITDFARTAGDKPVKFKAASIDSGLFIGSNQLEPLTRLKSKNELIADVVALLQSPVKNVISGLQSGKHKLAGIVKTLSERPQ